MDLLYESNNVDDDDDDNNDHDDTEWQNAREKGKNHEKIKFNACLPNTN